MHTVCICPGLDLTTLDNDIRKLEHIRWRAIANPHALKDI